MAIRAINNVVFVRSGQKLLVLMPLVSEDSTNDEESDDGVEEAKPECEKSYNEEESVAEVEIPFVTHCYI